MPLSSKREQEEHLEQKLNLALLALFKWCASGSAQEKGGYREGWTNRWETEKMSKRRGEIWDLNYLAIINWAFSVHISVTLQWSFGKNQIFEYVRVQILRHIHLSIHSYSSIYISSHKLNLRVGVFSMNMVRDPLNYCFYSPCSTSPDPSSFHPGRKRKQSTKEFICFMGNSNRRLFSNWNMSFCVSKISNAKYINL